MFELSRVKLVRKLPGGESKKVRVSGRFQLLRVRVIGIQLYLHVKKLLAKCVTQFKLSSAYVI